MKGVPKVMDNRSAPSPETPFNKPTLKLENTNNEDEILCHLFSPRFMKYDHPSGISFFLVVAFRQAYCSHGFPSVFLVGAFSLKKKSPTNTVGSFFSRRFSSEKCPTITVASFFFFFFVRLQSHSD